MEFMLANVLFSVVFKVGGIALGLGAILFFGWRVARPYIKKRKHKTLVARILWAIWIGAMLVAILSVAFTTGPRVTINDHGQQRPTYEKGDVQNLNPNTTTDDERVRSNRALIEENKQ